MAARGLHRGNDMYFDEAAQCWRYSTDDVVVADAPERACGYCGLDSTPQGHDGCLGMLPGVANACCGHGCDDEAYIQFAAGGCIRGPRALAWMRDHVGRYG